LEGLHLQVNGGKRVNLQLEQSYQNLLLMGSMAALAASADS